MQKLSICIPSYNYANYLGFTIKSCLISDYDFELVVLDNCSSDDTPLLKKQFEHDKRVKWFRNENVLPIQENWNKAVSLTTGEYVKLLQADDLLLPDFFNLFEKNISNFGQLGLFGHLSIIIDGNGNEIRRQASYGDLPLYYITPSEAIKLKLRNIARFKEPSCNFFLKKAWEEVGGYRDDLRYVFDIAFNIAVSQRFGGLLINEFGSGLRRHSTSDGAKLPASLAVNDLQKLVNEMLHDLGEECTKSDKIAGYAMIQYRVFELFLQRFKAKPFNSVSFLVSNFKTLGHISSIPQSLGIVYRKFVYGDVQNSFEKV